MKHEGKKFTLSLKYIFAESSMRRHNDWSGLISPIYDSDLSSDGCIVVAVHMHGVDMGTFRLSFPHFSNKKG